MKKMKSHALIVHGLFEDTNTKTDDFNETGLVSGAGKRNSVSRESGKVR